MADDDKQVTLRVPTWLYRSVILAVLAGIIAMGQWWYHELRADIDAKADRAVLEERIRSIERQLEVLWRRSQR